MADSGTPLSRSRLSTNFTNWNVNGLNHPIKCTRVLAHLKHLKTDAAFLTERQMCSSDYISVFHSSFQVKARGVVNSFRTFMDALLLLLEDFITCL